MDEIPDEVSEIIALRGLVMVLILELEASGALGRKGWVKLVKELKTEFGAEPASRAGIALLDEVLKVFDPPKGKMRDKPNRKAMLRVILGGKSDHDDKT